MNMSAEKFPMPLETLLASTVAMLKEHGAVREISVLLDAEPKVVQVGYDNWNGGTYEWCVELHTHHRIFGSLGADDRVLVEHTIGKSARGYMPDNHSVGFRLYAAPVRDTNWRDDAKAALAGVGINNQGRVRTDNIASLQEDGLLFRSQSEIRLYRALKCLGVTFAPLPVFVRGGETYDRFEPDFVLVKDGRVMVVEVDGDSYHRETPVEAQRRLRPLDHEGAKIERVAASEITSAAAAHAKAIALVEILNKFARR